MYNWPSRAWFPLIGHLQHPISLPLGSPATPVNICCAFSPQTMYLPTDSEGRPYVSTVISWSVERWQGNLPALSYASVSLMFPDTFGSLLTPRTLPIIITHVPFPPFTTVVQ